MASDLLSIVMVLHFAPDAKIRVVSKLPDEFNSKTDYSLGCEAPKVGSFPAIHVFGKSPEDKHYIFKLLWHLPFSTEMKEALSVNLAMPITIEEEKLTTNKRPNKDSIVSITKCFIHLENSVNVGIEFFKTVFAASFTSCQYILKTRKRWSEIPQIENIKISDKIEVIKGWRQLAYRDGVNFFIAPDPKGGFRMLAVNAWIPKDDRQLWIHSVGYMAQYRSKEDAISHAKEIEVQKERTPTN